MCAPFGHEYDLYYLCHLLGQVEARIKLFIKLSNGKPDDYDTYRGNYGIADTRHALTKAKRDGIHSFSHNYRHRGLRLFAVCVWWS